MFIIQSLILPEKLEMRLRQMCIDGCMGCFGFTTVDGISDLVTANESRTVGARSLSFIPNTDFSQPYEDNLRKKLKEMRKVADCSEVQEPVHDVPVLDSPIDRHKERIQ